MAQYIPFVRGDESVSVAKKLYADAECVRISLDRWTQVGPQLAPLKLWIDPAMDGLDDLAIRTYPKYPNNPWVKFIEAFDGYKNIVDPAFQAKPDPKIVNAFVQSILTMCAQKGPAWISVPQLPIVDGAERNKINRTLALATGTWRSKHKFSGKLILPLIFTHQRQSNGKTARNPKVQQAERCYQESQADGYWVVDHTLVDDNGSTTLRSTRFPGLVDLHRELNDRISTKIRVAGPYWGLNLVLWARGLIDHPAIGVGRGYQYFLAGGRLSQPAVRIAIPPLRRRANVAQLEDWLESAIDTIGVVRPEGKELSELKKRLHALALNSLEQVARFYKEWFVAIANQPATSRALALFQDLSSAYALGKGLPDMPGEIGLARRPEATAEPLMLNCL
jgi:hypothetical protein